MRSLFDVLERRDHDVAEERDDFDQFEDSIHSGQRDSFLVVHLVDVALSSVHQIQTESYHLE